jgi:hypothetical protein
MVAGDDRRPMETNTMLMSNGIAIRFTSRTFIVLDRFGVHVSLCGREVAYTRGFGWVRG